MGGAQSDSDPDCTFGHAFPDAAERKEFQGRCVNASALNFFGLISPPGDVGAAIDAVNQVHQAIAHGSAPW